MTFSRNSPMICQGHPLRTSPGILRGISPRIPAEAYQKIPLEFI